MIHTRVPRSVTGPSPPLWAALIQAHTDTVNSSTRLLCTILYTLLKPSACRDAVCRPVAAPLLRAEFEACGRHLSDQLGLGAPTSIMMGRRRAEA